MGVSCAAALGVSPPRWAMELLPSHPLPARTLPLLCLLPPPAAYKVGFPGQGVRCWGGCLLLAGTPSRGTLIPGGAMPPALLGAAGGHRYPAFN